METVSFFTFLEEKITEILFQLFFLALVAFLLIFYGVDTLFVVLLVILFISIQGLFQWCLYRKKRKASQHIIDLVDGLEETYYIADVLPKPKEFQNECLDFQVILLYYFLMIIYFNWHRWKKYVI